MKQTGNAVTLTYGSSGQFAQQIMAGAPYELFLCADEQYVLRLQASGLALAAGSPTYTVSYTVDLIVDKNIMESAA